MTRYHGSYSPERGIRIEVEPEPVDFDAWAGELADYVRKHPLSQKAPAYMDLAWRIEGLTGVQGADLDHLVALVEEKLK